jgi:hypothetical protein
MQDGNQQLQAGPKSCPTNEINPNQMGEHSFLQLEKECSHVVNEIQILFLSHLFLCYILLQEFAQRFVKLGFHKRGGSCQSFGCAFEFLEAFQLNPF